MGILLLLAMAATNSQPMATTVVAMTEDPATVADARQVRDHLHRDPRLSVRQALVTPARPVRSEQRLDEVRGRIAEARTAYESLAPSLTLQKLGDAQLDLVVMLDEPVGRALLADVHRLQALTHLYQRDSTKAAKAFVTASFLEPDWSPAQQEWPPEARLAHADALATTRRATPGVLSVHVQPALSVLWLDGRRIGVGATTVSDLPPGEHLLMATAPGHAPLAAVVEVAGGGRLSEASLYLESHADQPSVQDWAVLAAAAFDGTHELSSLAALAEELGGDDLVVISADPLSTNGARVAWIVRADGRRDGSFVALAPTSEAVTAISDRLLGIDRVTHAVAKPGARPWYLSPWAWGAAGGVLLATGAAVVWAVTRDETDRVSLFIGRGEVTR